MKKNNQKISYWAFKNSQNIIFSFLGDITIGTFGRFWFAVVQGVVENKPFMFFQWDTSMSFVLKCIISNPRDFPGLGNAFSGDTIIGNFANQLQTITDSR